VGAAEESRQAVTRHRSALADVVQAVRELAETVQACRRQLSTHGPIGASENPDLDRARRCLDIAHQRLIDAAYAAAASREPGLRYVDRVFPP